MPPITMRGSLFVTELLQVRETERLGCTAEGFLGLQHHPWFHEFDWEALVRRSMQPPYVPEPGQRSFTFEDLEPQVLMNIPFDPIAKEAIFKQFGPCVSPRWDDVALTPPTREFFPDN